MQGIAADIYVPGQSNLQTANQALESSLFKGVGWYEEGYRGPNGEGPHVHVDLRKTDNVSWSFTKEGKKLSYIPQYKKPCP